jgi:hypothetical protein
LFLCIIRRMPSLARAGICWELIRRLFRDNSSVNIDCISKSNSV